MRVTTFGMTLVLLTSPACGPGQPDEKKMTGEEESPMPDLGQAESLGDPNNCGELGLGPTLSQCYGATGTCSEICALEGRSCAPTGATARRVGDGRRPRWRRRWRYADSLITSPSSRCA
jgi:hypothetical protein